MTEEKKSFPVPSEKDQEEIILLKQRADVMGLSYHHRAGLKKLKALVEAGITPPKEEPALEPVEAKQVVEVKPKVTPTNAPKMVRHKLNGQTVIGDPSQKHESRAQRVARLRKEANKLIRVNISCMNKHKSEWEGEIYTVSNSVIGTIKKFVPFTGENGFHVPAIILQAMQEKEYQNFKTVTDRRGNKVRRGFIEKELSIEILPPLTSVQMKDLAAQQALHNNVD